MAQSIVDARDVRLNARIDRDTQQVHAREVRIDKQRASFEFELVTVGTEVGHAYAVASSCARIAHNELSTTIETSGECLRR